MLRRWVLCLGMLSGLCLGAQGSAPPPTASEKELQAPLTLEDGKPTQGQAAEAPPSGLRAFGSLVLVLGLAGASLWALKKYGRGRMPGGGGTKLKVEETLALGDRRFVSILDVEGERFLIALTPQGIGLLSRLDPGERGEPGTFDEALSRQVDLGRPVPVKEMEALLKQGGGGQ
ncbi:flagellar biosynthetic protein FliO [Geothrix sp. PMB-07]|uniref:FliO/MopB family protein n=1 Tax=Geothrix sp. PMB-07 TaxID=3068640 RepID=UPI0027428BB7|nr:flagellar biosynthetic protein FliO [Geothrix sp. PMB-07]WLT33298.1 flagellar biosynthetic protein FliO [Geothrix sp. PMB-07]